MEPMYQQPESWSLQYKGQPVGTITSAVYSPDLDKNIALAMVDIEYSDVGASLTIDMGLKTEEATITPLPFIDNRAKVWKGIIDP
jgi:glycine cleavage system aminomethyltransferase T